MVVNSYLRAAAVLTVGLMITGGNCSYDGGSRTPRPSSFAGERLTWERPRSEHDVIIGAASEQLTDQAIEQDHNLVVTIDDVDVDRLDELRWELRLPRAGEDIIAPGQLTTVDWVEVAEDGRSYGSATIDFGRICGDGEVQDCFPCWLDEGCEFTLKIDLCGISLEDKGSAKVQIERHDGWFYFNSCTSSSEDLYCDFLDRLVEVETVALDTPLCGG